MEKMKKVSSDKILILNNLINIICEKKSYLSEFTPPLAIPHQLIFLDNHSTKIDFCGETILIISTDYYLKHQAKIKKFFETHKKGGVFSIILIYRGDKINQFDKRDHFFFNSMLEEKLVDLFLPRIVENEMNRLNGMIEEMKTMKRAEELGKSLLSIGMKIGSDKNTFSLLNEILIESMKLTRADAGTIALRGFDMDLCRSDEKQLTFYTSYNFSKKIEFTRFSLELNEESLAGYCILNQKILNIEDAYEIGEAHSYRFNRSFDDKTGFRTKSMLVVPMVNNLKKVFGMIQLMNKKETFEKVIDYTHLNISEIRSFTQFDESNMEGISNFASISTENAILYQEIQTSFESFVRASVYAVEQRDPATSGHSDRVAGYCVKMAEACNKSKGELENFNFNEEEIKELRYAALLHDFGKIGVKESVLIKQKKLEDYELLDICRKFKIYILQKQLETEKEKVALVKNNQLSIEELDKKLRHLEHSIKKESEYINRLLDQVIQSNEPTILEESSSKILEEVNQMTFELDQHNEKILNDREFEFLQIKKGSLSKEERKEIESHVTHSYQFLERIPWGGNLQHIPEIAYGHHEKLDGSGYPLGIDSQKIMPQTKIMTVCDIFDALVAADRPYKKALSVEKALNILNLESGDGKIDQRLVDMMIRKKIYKIYQKK